MKTLLAAIVASLLCMGIASLFKKSKARKKVDALSNPRDVESNLRIAIELLSEKKIDEALNFLNNIDRDINMACTVLADSLKGKIYFERVDFSNAKECLEFVINNKSYLSDEYELNVAYSYCYLGGIYFSENNYTLAKEYKENAINMNNVLRNINIPECEGYTEL